jgi:hypothetical protein
MGMRHIPNMVSINKITRPGKRQRFVQTQNSIQPLTAGSGIQTEIIPSQPSIMPLPASTAALEAKDAIWMTTRV